jgi:predicted DNA-binding protein
MKTLQVRLPDHIYEKIKYLAKDEGISMNNFIVSSISNEVVRQETRDFFKKAASNFNAQVFDEALAAIPDAPVPVSDKI